MAEIKGSCLCGAVKFEIEGQLSNASHCHCRLCQKAHGAAFASYAEANENDLEILTGAQLIKQYQSSPHTSRSFCGICGSNLFWKDSNNKGIIDVALACLDSGFDESVSRHIYTESKAGWLD